MGRLEELPKDIQKKERRVKELYKASQAFFLTHAVHTVVT